MVVDSSMLAMELRRRRDAPKALAASVAGVSGSTWVLGELHSAPTSMLVLAAFALIPGGGGRAGETGEPLLGG